ncbi:MAG: hypothetical protein ACI835_002085, partial [Planctomycetota bacterium]
MMESRESNSRGSHVSRLPLGLCLLEARRVLLGKSGAAIALWLLFLLAIGQNEPLLPEEIGASEQVARGLERQSFWALILFLLLPLAFLRTANLAHRLRSGESDWIGMHASSKSGAIACSFGGSLLAIVLLSWVILASIEGQLSGDAASFERLATRSQTLVHRIDSGAALSLDLDIAEPIREGDEIRLRVLAAVMGTPHSPLPKESSARVSEIPDELEHDPKSENAAANEDDVHEDDAHEDDAHQQDKTDPSDPSTSSDHAGHTHSERPDTLGPATDARLVLARGSATVFGEVVRVGSRTWLSARAPAGTGRLMCQVECIAGAPLLVLDEASLEIWRPTESERGASMRLLGHVLWTLVAGMALAAGLGFWLGPITASATVLAIGVGLSTFTGLEALPGAALLSSLETIGEGRVPVAPNLGSAALSIMIAVLGLALGRWGLQSW